MEESVNLQADALARWFCDSPQGRKPPDIGVNPVCVPAGNARASLGRWGRQRGTGKGVGWAGAGRRVAGRTRGVGGVTRARVSEAAGAQSGRAAGAGELGLPPEPSLPAQLTLRGHVSPSRVY